MHIYKVVTAAQWRAAEAKGVFDGAPVDVRDGYIHFSTADQLEETLSRHFAGQTDLLIIAFESDSFGDALKWEPSRGGQLFPHLYAPLKVSLALSVRER
ncbi:MAG: DUF952 domain-containing protein [Archangium sp.]